MWKIRKYWDSKHQNELAQIGYYYIYWLCRYEDSDAYQAHRTQSNLDNQMQYVGEKDVQGIGATWKRN